jgi:hypothetical protein
VRVIFVITGRRFAGFAILWGVGTCIQARRRRIQDSVMGFFKWRGGWRRILASIFDKAA